jgi:serine-type D-Ala-D-Ala carboxypeptidase (penicillin-binding protein 5/6)
MSIRPIPLRLTLFTLLALWWVLGAADSIPSPPPVTAKSYVLVDFDSGRVLAESNADERLEPASLTKIMAMDVVFKEIASGNVKLTDPVLISEHAWRTGGSRTFANVGKSFSVEQLLKGAIIQSGNDATVALAEHIAGSEATFAEMMNAQAKRLGMTNSHFVNSTGLPHQDHYTTARDIAKVTAATIRNYPELYKLYSIKEFELNNIKQLNRNKLLWRDPSVDGVKTGHTDEAGYCLVASAERDGERLISVILGSKSVAQRTADSEALLSYGFRFFETHKLYGQRQSVAKVRVWKGDPAVIDAGPAQAVYVTIPRQQYKNLQPHLELTTSVMAPVAADQKLGRILVSLNGEQIADVPVVALSESKRGGIFRRMKDSVLLWFH